MHITQKTYKLFRAGPKICLVFWQQNTTPIGGLFAQIFSIPDQSILQQVTDFVDEFSSTDSPLSEEQGKMANVFIES